MSPQGSVKDALQELLLAEEAFGLASPSLVHSIDNIGLLLLDITWCAPVCTVHLKAPSPRKHASPPRPAGASSCCKTPASSQRHMTGCRKRAAAWSAATGWTWPGCGSCTAASGRRMLCEHPSHPELRLSLACLQSSLSPGLHLQRVQHA